MTNAEIEQKGIVAVIEYEKQQGRPNVARVSAHGYDLLSKGDDEERHIEVKSTTQDRFTLRWLEQNEYEAFQKDEKWFLYLVTNVGSIPKVYEYNRANAKKRFSKEIKHYFFKFPKTDFE